MAMRSAQNTACNAQCDNFNAQHATRDAHLRACWRFLERAALQSFSPQSQRGPYKTESCAHARARANGLHTSKAASSLSSNHSVWLHGSSDAGDTVFDKHSCPAASKCGWPQSIHCEKVRKSGRTLPQCIRCEGASSAGRQVELFMTCGGARCRAQGRRLKLDKRKCASAHEKNA
jgi:hypothetical protein